MTRRATQTATPVETVYWVTLSVRCDTEGSYSLIPDNELNFEVRNGDEIHMLRPLGRGQAAPILLKLEDGASIAGLSFGKTSEEALRHEKTRDTGGAHYPGTSFKVSPGPLPGSVSLTIVRDPDHEDLYDWKPWYFDIWPEGGGPRIDPKIYNKGDQDPPPKT